MGKHNGKARPSGVRVGAALANRAKAGAHNSSRPRSAADRNLYTTDPQAHPQLASNLENSDLGELMEMAELADRDFTAQRGDVVVISTGAPNPIDQQRVAAHRREAEERNKDRLCLPRRPHWTPAMTAGQVEVQERQAFVAWRRQLARLEEEEGLVLTPFEKNLEVWRQLWRVVERSHLVVQVVDARDPLRYWSEDLRALAGELDPPKPSMLLLNKADLLPTPLRSAWADYLDARGLDYVFWSAKAATEPELHAELFDSGEGDARTRLASVADLLQILESKTQAATDRVSSRAHQSGAEDESEGSEDDSGPARLVVGLTGYPNVGKSSTINAVFGSKKTPVAPTPGKTKHFQTLNVSPGLTFCDCPGLVLPTYAASKADLVAAGVIPIARLTDVRAPVEVVAQRIPRTQWQQVYGVQLPKPGPGDDPDRQPTAAEVLRAVATARGWVVQQALPDEARAGRLVLRDFCSGRLLHCRWPPGAPDNTAATSRGAPSEPSEAAGPAQQPAAPLPSSSHHANNIAGNERMGNTAFDIESNDLDLMASLDISGQGQKPRRADHKFHKKPPARKARATGAVHGYEGSDGSAIHLGRRGGLVRVSSGS
ncbi:hypothetical protein WJX73_008324 [Symbiochloris irregularis]|uniref:CP-type G domain-containing protein n=1 Tax=Symbiochloris irregularis TaxID=706552 RepID=A0AAW1NZK6_9CHLO